MKLNEKCSRSSSRLTRINFSSLPFLSADRRDRHDRHNKSINNAAKARDFNINVSQTQRLPWTYVANMPDCLEPLRSLALICLQFDLSQFTLSWHFSAIVDLHGAGPVNKNSSPTVEEGSVNRTSSAALFEVGKVTGLIVMPTFWSSKQLESHAHADRSSLFKYRNSVSWKIQIKILINCWLTDSVPLNAPKTNNKLYICYVCSNRWKFPVY